MLEYYLSYIDILKLNLLDRKWSGTEFNLNTSFNSSNTAQLAMNVDVLIESLYVNFRTAIEIN